MSGSLGVVPVATSVADCGVGAQLFRFIPSAFQLGLPFPPALKTQSRPAPSPGLETEAGSERTGLFPHLHSGSCRPKARASA